LLEGEREKGKGERDFTESILERIKENSLAALEQGKGKRGKEWR
jgi:hypothetical protein